VTSFDEASVEAAVRGTAERLGVKAGVLIHPARVGLVGRTTSPGLFESMVLLGRERTLARLERAAAIARGPGTAQ
jgi:glutamyl-tRNA synthetase